MSTAQSRQLRTWKEIAEHLRISVRTAQNWERERGLPILRIAGDKPQVRAWTADLDQWLTDEAKPRKPSPAVDAQPILPTQGPSSPPSFHVGHLAVCGAGYASLFVLDLFLEVAFQFDSRGGPAKHAAPILWLWIIFTSSSGLWLTWRMRFQNGMRRFVVLVAVFAVSGLLTVGVLSFSSVLPPTPVTQLDFPAQSAEAAYLKNVVFYFLPLVAITWLIPFHFVTCVHKHFWECGPSAALALMDQKMGFASGGDAFYFPVRGLVIGMLIQGFTSVILTQDLLRHLLPAPATNLFMILAIFKSSLYWALGICCIAWYSRALLSVRAACIGKAEDSIAAFPKGMA